MLQRGNRQHPNNAVIAFDLGAVTEMLHTGGTSPVVPTSLHRFCLDSIGDVPLTVTDAAALPDGRIVFSAVAEDTDDAYHDGACVGAAIGMLDAGSDLRFLQRLSRPHKIEGIHAEFDGRQLELLAVTDADDIDVPASLFAATIEI